MVRCICWVELVRMWWASTEDLLERLNVLVTDEAEALGAFWKILIASLKVGPSSTSEPISLPWDLLRERVVPPLVWLTVVLYVVMWERNGVRKGLLLL